MDQARITVECMGFDTTFRIAGAIRIILFMGLSMVIFDFYPITEPMIIPLALSNDIPILTIAYDRTKVQRVPVRWKMPGRRVVSSVRGPTGGGSSLVPCFLLWQPGLAEISFAPSCSSIWW